MRYPWTRSDHGHAVNVRGSRADLVRWLGEPSEVDAEAADRPRGVVWCVVPRPGGWTLRRSIFGNSVPVGAVWPTRLRASGREWTASLEEDLVRVGCSTVPLRQLADLVTARESLLRLPRSRRRPTEVPVTRTGLSALVTEGTASLGTDGSVTLSGDGWVLGLDVASLLRLARRVRRARPDAFAKTTTHAQNRHHRAR